MHANLIYFVLPFILLLIGFPIYLILLVTSTVAILLVADVPTTTLQTYMFGGLDNFPLMAVPFFIFAGEIMGQGGIARRLIAWVMSIVGGVRGSLALTTVASSELFGAIAHSSVGTVAAVGRLIYPALRENKYGETFSASMIASSGGVAIVIPPSISMILYAMSANQSAVFLFTAGIFPSILIGLVDATYVLLHAHIKMVPLAARARWENIWETTKEASWSIGTLVVIFGGIYGGVFTPTEAAGVAVVYSLFVTMVIHRDISWADLWQITVNATFLIAQILIIVTAAGIYSWLLTTSGIPQEVVAFFKTAHMPPWEVMLLINLGLLMVGSFLEPPAAITILTPLLLPIVRAAGIDPIHFGIIMAVNLSIGMYLPPFGLNLFAAQALFDLPLARLYRGVLPFVLINFGALLLITYIPEISMVLLGHNR